MPLVLLHMIMTLQHGLNPHEKLGTCTTNLLHGAKVDRVYTVRSELENTHEHTHSSVSSLELGLGENSLIASIKQSESLLVYTVYFKTSISEYVQTHT